MRDTIGVAVVEDSSEAGASNEASMRHYGMDGLTGHPVWRQSTPKSDADISALDTDNPFRQIAPEELDQMVKDFLERYSGLEPYAEFLRCGARLAKDKTGALYYVAQSLHLTPEQKDHIISEESEGLWEQSKYLRACILVTVLSGMIQNGGNTGMTLHFGLHYDPSDPARTASDQWLFGTLASISFLAGGLLVPFFSDPLQEYLLGRRGTIAVFCIINIAGTIGQAFSADPLQLGIFRAITGVALAGKASSAPLLLAEAAPNHIRGRLLATWQLSDALGIFFGAASNLALLQIPVAQTTTWRINLSTVLIPCIILLFLVYLVPGILPLCLDQKHLSHSLTSPESPRLLMKEGRYLPAFESFVLYRPGPAQHLLAARDLIYAHFQLQMECNAAQTELDDLETPWQEEMNVQIPSYSISQSTYLQRLLQAFDDGRSRRALICAVIPMLSQQLTGVNSLIFLSNTILPNANASGMTGAWVSFALGLCNFIFGIPAFWLFDKVGRATMLLLGFVPMFVSMLVLAFSFEESIESSVRRPIAITFGILFIMAYSPTAGPAPWAISAEVFPLVIREVGHSLAVSVFFVALGIFLLCFIPLSVAMGGYKGSVTLFACLNLVALVLCFLFVPETRGRTLEELRTIFDIPTKRHIQYRLTVVLPWLVERYLISWLSGLLPWREGRGSQETDSIYDTGLVAFHDWHMIDLDFQRLKKEQVERKKLEKTQKAKRDHELRELRDKWDLWERGLLPTHIIRSSNDHDKLKRHVTR